MGRQITRPPLKSLIDHIDHIAKVAGVDHVGLGSDFDGVSGATPEGIDPPPTCQRSRRPCWVEATAKKTSTKFSAETCCESSEK